MLMFSSDSEPVCDFCGERLQEGGVYFVGINPDLKWGVFSITKNLGLLINLEDGVYFRERILDACGPDCVGFLWTYYSLLTWEDFCEGLEKNRELINKGKTTAGRNGFVEMHQKALREKVSINAETEEKTNRTV